MAQAADRAADLTRAMPAFSRRQPLQGTAGAIWGRRSRRHWPDGR